MLFRHRMRPSFKVLFLKKQLIVSENKKPQLLERCYNLIKLFIFGLEVLVIAHVLMFGSLMAASILGIYGQGMAYFMNEKIAEIPPIYYLTVLTFISIFLYVITDLLTYIYT